jgi:hypothetical protein
MKLFYTGVIGLTGRKRASSLGHHQLPGFLIQIEGLK